MKEMGANKRLRLLVLYGSQTGTAQDAADRVGREAARRGCPAVDVLSIDEFDAVRILAVQLQLYRRLSCFSFFTMSFFVVF